MRVVEIMFQGEPALPSVPMHLVKVNLAFGSAERAIRNVLARIPYITWMTGKSNVLYPANLVTLCRHADLKAIDSQSSGRVRGGEIAKSAFDKINFTVTHECVCVFVYMSANKNKLSGIIFIASIRCHSKSRFTMSQMSNATAFGDPFWRNRMFVGKSYAIYIGYL